MKKRVVVALGGNALGNSLPEQKIAVKTPTAPKFMNWNMPLGSPKEARNEPSEAIIAIRENVSSLLSKVAAYE